VGTAENRLEKTKKKAAGDAAVFGLGEERNGSQTLFFWREVSGRERPGCGLLLPLPLLRERLLLAGVGDAAAEAGGGRFCGAASPLLLIAGRGSVDGAAVGKENRRRE